MNNPTRGLTLVQLLGWLAVLAVIGLILVKACTGKPLTKASGQAAGDDIFRELSGYVAGTGPISELSGQIDSQITTAIDAVKGKEGAADFAAGLCERVLELINNRIRSTPDAVEKTRLTEVKRIVETACTRAHAGLTAPPPK
jgi:hypothetical protein